MMFDVFAAQPEMKQPLENPNQRLARLQGMFPPFMKLAKDRSH
jgi:hypothetical protein